MDTKIKTIQANYKTQISESKTLKDLDSLFLKLFGKNGEITLLPRDFSNLSKDELKIIGPLFNLLKKNLEESIEDKRLKIREQSYKNLASENLDSEEIDFSKI